MKIETYGMLQGLLAPEFEIEGNGSVQSVLDAIVEKYPAFAEQVERTACAVGDDLVQRDHALQAQDILVLIPPVAGG